VPSNINLEIDKYDGQNPPSSSTTPLATDAPTTVTTAIAGQKYLTLSANGYTSGYTLYLGDPKVYCNADALPSWVNSDL